MAAGLGLQEVFLEYDCYHVLLDGSDTILLYLSADPQWGPVWEPV